MLRSTRGRLLPGGLAPWLNAALIRALRSLSGERPVLLLFGGEDDVQDQLARYGLDRLKGVDVDELPGIGHHFDDPDDVERVAAAMDAGSRSCLERSGDQRVDASIAGQRSKLSGVDVDPVRLLDDVATVHDQRLTRHVARLLAGQERDGGGDLAGVAGSTDGRRAPGGQLALRG